LSELKAYIICACENEWTVSTVHPQETILLMTRYRINDISEVFEDGTTPCGIVTHSGVDHGNP
jgi:hypothetical protein